MPPTNYKNYNSFQISCQEKERKERESQRSLPIKLSYDIPKNIRYYNRDFPELATKDTYEHFLNYVLMFEDENGNIVDMRVVKTFKTLEKFIEDKHNANNLIIHIHPNPVILNADFWSEYRKAENGYQRIAIFRKYKILSDENMLQINNINIDIDSKYEDSIKALDKLISILNIPTNCLTIIKTKSGNLRFSFSIEPLNPRKINRNKKTHLENVKEFVKVVNEFFTQEGLKADKTFERVNHPVIITAPQQVIQTATENVRFYNLYKQMKKLKRQLIKNKHKPKSKLKDRKIKLPAFILNKLKALETKTSLEKAVETLYNNNKHKGTYIHFLQVVAGWCKYLSMSYQEYYDLVYKYVSHRKGKDRDIETAYERANVLEFKGNNIRKDYSFVDMAKKLLEYLEVNGDTDRQTLLKEVFYNQKWLLDLITNELSRAGIIEYTFEKQSNPKGGRPKKVYILKKPANTDEMEFSHIITKKPSGFFDLVVVGNTTLPSEEKEKEGKGRDFETLDGAGKQKKRTLERITEEEFEEEFKNKNKNKIKNQIENQEEKEKMEKMVVDLVAYRDRIVGLIERHLNYQGKKISKKQQRHLQEYFFMKFENDMKVIQKGGDGGLLAYFNWLRIFKQIEHDLIEFVERLL